VAIFAGHVIPFPIFIWGPLFLEGRNEIVRQLRNIGEIFAALRRKQGWVYNELLRKTPSRM
jgi:hypothetical protein